MSAAAFTELRIPLRHLTLAAKAWGNPGNPPMLAVHGWLDNAATFDRLAPFLDGHYLIAIDLAGHGRSDHRSPANWYAYADYLDEIGEVIEWFGWSMVDLLGHSLGATLLSTFAAICPQQVRRLLLIEGLGPLTQVAGKTLEQLRRAHLARSSFRSDRLRVFANLDEAVAARRRLGNLSERAARCIVERGVKPVSAQASQLALNRAVDSSNRSGDSRRMFDVENSRAIPDLESKPGDRDSGLEDSRGIPFTKGGSDDPESRLDNSQAFPGLSWSSDPQLTIPSSTRLTEEQLAVVLPAIEAPTCLILAEPNAPYLAPEMIVARIALLRDIEVVRMTGTHHLHLEDPQPVAAVLRDFLHRHSLPAQAPARIP